MPDNVSEMQSSTLVAPEMLGTGTPAYLGALAAQAEAVRAVADDYTDAVRAERDAEALVLERAVAVIAPALRAICTWIESDRTMWIDSDREHETTNFPKPGIILAGGWERMGSSNDARGEYGGEALVLWRDGTLGELTYSGAWTRCQREADCRNCAVSPVTVREAMDYWDLEECLATLTEALDAQIKSNKPDRSEKARARAAKLAAAATLPLG